MVTIILSEGSQIYTKSDRYSTIDCNVKMYYDYNHLVP
jgi:hypothetical protein